MKPVKFYLVVVVLALIITAVAILIKKHQDTFNPIIEHSEIGGHVK